MLQSRVAPGRRRVVKLTVVLLGLVWCSSVPLAPAIHRALAHEPPAMAQSGPDPFEEGLAQARKGDWHSARVWFLRAAHGAGDSGMRPLAFAWLEHSARQIGGPVEAVRTFEAMRHQDRADSLARVHLCRALLDRAYPGDTDAAWSLVREGIAQGDERSYDLHRMAAELSLARGNLPAARGHLEAAQREALGGSLIRVMASRPQAKEPVAVAQ